MSRAQRFLGVSLVALLGGCANLDKTFDNRVVCAVGEPTGYSLSLYGPVGLSSKINSQDAQKICGVSSLKEPIK